ncbi:LysM peptidoglycan-binding domain-containing protein [Candidatus Sumerlaeota bacterium]|nr:LysM peptidoglycan-binding domain-containing protein [Candidatus Sumerlaeota bacterium]
MRTRSFAIAVLMLGAASTMFMAGCSGKPENSPAIRKKFTEYDKTQKTVEELSATVASLSEEVKRVSNENSELRLMMPEAQNSLTKVDAAAAPVQTANAAAPATTDALATAPLEEQPLAGSPPPVAAAATENSAAPAPAPAPAKAAEAPKEVKQAKETKKDSEKKVVASSFKEKTTKAKPTVVKTSSAAPSTRGKFHDIAPGETVDSIAAKYNISKEALMKANGMPAGAKISRAQRLFIPAAH